ncbi:M23 family metallopeptidase [Candidatus Gracilibacteria bacterium 28_42_T64]|nr:M23 family metallopeptidase [Candidatus Gracilibacteria bacterium 28_42_T64]
MKKSLTKFCQTGLLGIFIVTNIIPIPTTLAASNDKIIYPLKEISKLECRFKEFSELTSDCKQNLPVLKTKDYKKYANEDGGYNQYTRIYTELWGASYKYGWDVGNGGHIGTDIATSKGTPIYSIANGEVILAKNTVGLGNTVSVKHTIKGKVIVSNYSHMSKINVRKGQKISVGMKVGEVGSTGNSTGNHLHFQIDLDTPFHPYYYAYSKCPYSYYKITETGVCFDELQVNTIDPLLFLETNGGILDSIKIVKTSSQSSTQTPTNNSTVDLSIFTKTVYIGYSSSDIKEVQQIFRDLGEYNGSINGDYKDIEKSMIAYQISNNIIKNKTDLGAGWFGPKTRKQVKNDYTNFLASGGKTKISSTIATSSIKTEKISKANLMTREEIEEKEAKEFIRKYNIEFKLNNIGGNIESGKTTTVKLKVTDKRGRPFKGNMPAGMTFIVDTTKVSVFPQKLYNFTDGKRDIKLSGLKTGNTTLFIKIGQSTVKSIPLQVYAAGNVVYPNTAKIYSSRNIVLGDKKTGIALFKDKNGRKLINLKYGSSFKLKTTDGVEVCIKRGSLKNIRQIYKKSCNDSDYTDTIDFDYTDTVGGLLIFDYKAISKDAKITIINDYGNKNMSSKTLSVTNPKGLKSNYAYKNDVVKMLENGIVDGINKGYFLESRELVEVDALNWIENSLIKIKDSSVSGSTVNIINKKLSDLKAEKLSASRFRSITRQDFLDLNYKYLVLNNNKVITKKYKDLDSLNNKKASYVLSNTTWKDKFGENYFRPNLKVTRGEGAFMIANILDTNTNIYLTSK